MTTFDQIVIADLRGVPEEKQEVLRRVAVRRGIPLSRLLGELAEQAADTLLEASRKIEKGHKEAA